MEYFDSDVIFNCITEQDTTKYKQANEIFLKAVEREVFIISGLVLSEVGYGLARAGLSNEQIRSELEFYNALSIAAFDQSHIARGLELAGIIGFKHVNDCIHTAIAESLNCSTFYTYNKSDFKRIQRHTNLNINILGSSVEK